jgi:hypothetical protein
LAAAILRDPEVSGGNGRNPVISMLSKAMPDILPPTTATTTIRPSADASAAMDVSA